MAAGKGVLGGGTTSAVAGARRRQRRRASHPTEAKGGQAGPSGLWSVQRVGEGVDGQGALRAEQGCDL